MKTDKIVKYAGVSVVSSEDGKVSHNFHTSNNSKYAVWSNLPNDVDGPGHSVTFHWFKMPADTTKIEAVRLLLPKFTDQEKVRNMLHGIMEAAAPKVKLPKARKVRPVKSVTVEVPAKSLSDTEAAKAKAANLAKIRDAAAKRKAA